MAHRSHAPPSFAPAYFAKQAFLFIRSYDTVFFVDIALYSRFPIRDLHNHDYDGSPTSTTFEVTDNLSATEDESGATVYKLPDNTASWLDQQNAWAMLVEMIGKSSGAHNAPPEIANHTYTQNDIANARARSTSKTTQHSSGRTVTMAPLS